MSQTIAQSGSAAAPLGGAGPERFIDPSILARIGNLDLVARAVVEGFISGLHRTFLPGASVDFAEHRAYMPGDDLRRVDWRVYARSDRLYVKEYEADTNVNLVVLLDVSKSMDYAGDAAGGARTSASLRRAARARPTKLDYGKFLAASLLYLSNKQRDRVGLVTFDADVIDYVPPSAKHLRVALTTLSAGRAGHAGDEESYARVMRKVAQTLRRRSMAVIISDLYAPPASIGRAVSALRASSSDVMLLHVLDPVELALPESGAATFEDLESGARLAVNPARAARAYTERMRQHLDAVERAVVRTGAHYALFDTSKPLDAALALYLSERRRMARAR